MPRPFAVFDIDGTIIRWQLYHSLTDQLGRLGVIPPKDYVELKESRMAWKRRTKLNAFRDYEQNVVRQFDAALKKNSQDQLQDIVQAVFQEYKDQAYAYTRELLQDLKKKGYFLLAISGSPLGVVNVVSDYYSFDDWRGTKHYFKDGRYTGAKRVVAYHKEKVLAELMAKHGLSAKGSIGVGDSHSDIKMLEMVELPIAFNPEVRLYQHAVKAGWKIVIERKNVIYELEKRHGQYQLATPGK